MKNKVLNSIKFVALLIIYFVCMTILEYIFPSDIEIELSSGVILGVIAQILLNSFVIVYLIHRLSLTRMKLIFVTTIVIYGMQIFMTQIETLIFIEAFPMIGKKTLAQLFVGGFLLFFIIASSAYLLWTSNIKREASKFDLKDVTNGWIWKIPILSVIYMILYISFGLLIAWRSEELRKFYENVEIDIYKLWFIQIFRRGLWILFCSPILIWLKGNRVEKIIIISFLLALLPTILLIFPNPFMPKGVRITHFIEVFISNGLFGIILAYLLSIKGGKIGTVRP